MNKWIVDKEHGEVEGFDWVQAVAHIRKNDTGEVRKLEVAELLSHDETHPSDFNWSENNYSCDCNRGLFFQRAGKEEEDWSKQCSDGKFSVNLENPVNGEIYYREFE